MREWIGRGQVAALLLGIALGICASGMNRAWAGGSVEPLRPVKVTLHRFDLRDGADPALREWLAHLAAHHREAVATLDRERMYLEAKFTLPDDPARLYWLTVEGDGGGSVETSVSELDRRHMAYMKRVLADGSDRRAETRDMLMPDFIAAAIRDQQAVER